MKRQRHNNVMNVNKTIAEQLYYSGLGVEIIDTQNKNSLSIPAFCIVNSNQTKVDMEIFIKKYLVSSLNKVKYRADEGRLQELMSLKQSYDRIKARINKMKREGEISDTRELQQIRIILRKCMYNTKEDIKVVRRKEAIEKLYLIVPSNCIDADKLNILMKELGM